MNARINSLAGPSKPQAFSSMKASSRSKVVVRVLERRNDLETADSEELFANRAGLMYSEDCDMLQQVTGLQFLGNEVPSLTRISTVPPAFERNFTRDFPLRSHPSNPLPPQAGQTLTQYMRENLDDSLPVARLAAPEDIEEAFASTSGVRLSLAGRQEPEDPARLTQAIRTTLDYSVRTGHNLFFNQLYARAEPAAVAGDWLAAAASTNVHSYEVSPVFTLMEQEVLAKLASYLGGDYSQPGRWDGLLTPGGSVANLYGMLMAQNEADPERKERGAAGGPVLVAFCSEAAHFSYEKAAHATGLGMRNLVKVRCREDGGMDPADLEARIVEAKAAGKRPFFIGATVGTTVRGAFDPLPALSDIATRHGLWLHADGCWGAASLLSRRHRHLARGIELSDSAAWSAHKEMGQSAQCSAFFVRGRSMTACNGTAAEYLFQPDKQHASLDLGDKTIMCGRRAEAVKLWLTWKRIGDDGWERRVNHDASLAQLAEGIVKKGSPRFLEAYPRSFLNVCFWYVPPCLRPVVAEHGRDPRAWPESQRARLHAVAPEIKRRMMSAGDAMISFQPMGPKVPNFFRLVLVNAARVSPSQLEAVFDRIDDYGADLVV